MTQGALMDTYRLLNKYKTLNCIRNFQRKVDLQVISDVSLPHAFMKLADLKPSLREWCLRVRQLFKGFSGKTPCFAKES